MKTLFHDANTECVVCDRRHFADSLIGPLTRHYGVRLIPAPDPVMHGREFQGEDFAMSSNTDLRESVQVVLEIAVDSGWPEIAARAARLAECLR
jgi:hypothetical protein